MFAIIRKINSGATALGALINNAIILSLFAICPIVATAQAPQALSSRLQENLLVDRDGNRYPIKVLLDGNLWLTANLKLNVANSWCYGDEKANCDRHGRLYIWKSANLGCKMLGEGWRLPTQPEYRRLTALYGGAIDSTEMRKGAYKALLNTGTSGFDASLGGGRAPNENEYARLDAHGFYWTASPSDSSGVWYFNFAKGSQSLFQQDGGEKTRAFSVRCVKSNRSSR